MARPLGERRREATALPAWIKPQLTKLVDQPPDGPEWLHELKYDGYRMHARLDRGAVRLLTRTGLDWTPKHPGGRAGNQDPSAVEATGHLFRRRPFFDRQGGRGLPGMQHRQYFAGKEPHRFLRDRERNPAKAERGGELEIAHDAPPLREHAKDTIRRTPHSGLHEPLGHPLEPGFADDLGFLRV